MPCSQQGKYMKKDEFGVEIKTYKDYVNQARPDDIIYRIYADGKYKARYDGFVDWELKRLHYDEDGNRE